jgi:signal transduction histidine kinase
MLGLLRTDDPVAPRPDGDGRVSAPDLARLPDLITQLLGSGLDVRLHTFGEPVDVTPGVSHCAYRVVQEGLTNVLKHAGASHADVVVTYTESIVRLEVADAGSATVSDGARLPSSGVVLLGLQERVALYGGALRAFPDGDGWRLVAELPYERAEPGSEVGG